MATVMTHHTVPAQVIADEARPFLADLRYDTADPLAVRIAFPAEASLVGTETTWTFARELLAAGIKHATGSGAVRLWPRGTDVVLLELQAPEGVAIVELAADAIGEFLHDSYELLPAGTETSGLDIDQALADLLHGT